LHDCEALRQLDENVLIELNDIHKAIELLIEDTRGPDGLRNYPKDPKSAADYEDILKYNKDVVKLHYSIGHRRSYLEVKRRRADEKLNAFQASLDNDDYDLD
jgi:hypothetical protein